MLALCVEREETENQVHDGAEFATLARYLYISLLFPFTFSQNFLFHAVAYVLSNRLLLFRIRCH